MIGKQPKKAKTKEDEDSKKELGNIGGSNKGKTGISKKGKIRKGIP